LGPKYEDSGESVGEEYDALDNGRIRTYIPTLVERGARIRLHHAHALKSGSNN
jgi:hypothetical protein